MKGKKRVLVICAHPDDEILGCGGTTARLTKEGHDVFVFVLGKGRGTFNDNAFDAQPLLNWVQNVKKEIKRCQPDIIFTHYEKDLNIDHRITYQAVITAARPQPGCCVKEIYSFEILSSTEWAFPISFSPDVFYDIIETIDSKLDAMRDKYKSELRKDPHPRSYVGIQHLAEYRGMQVGLLMAEAFKTVRRIL